jgi:GNAT superfamily N-acetyltransferase
MRVELRAATADDADQVATVFLRSRKELVAFAPLAHADDDVRGWVRRRLIPTGNTTVAVVDGLAVGLVAIARGQDCSWITHLYLLPEWIGRGLGARLLAIARRELPPPIRLYCFQENERACRFYERQGFTAIAFTDGANNEEKCPDVLYEWRPADGAPSPSASPRRPA